MTATPHHHHPHHDHSHPHQEKHFTSSEVVRDVVIGMADGLTVPFALAAGLSGAVASNGIIITAGIAEIVAGSIAMGLGGYLAGKTEVDHYASELQREHYEVAHFPEKERDEVREIFEDMGLSPEVTARAVDELAQDEKKWVDFMMRFELGLEQPDTNRAAASARNIGLSYVAGGLLPLAAYFFTRTPHQGLLLSAAITIVALFIFGYFKTRIIGQPPFSGAMKTVAVGVLAAGSAYAIASWFSGM